MSGSPLSGKRLVFVLNWSAMGGAERFALDTATYLRDVHDADVSVCALTATDGRAREEAEQAGIEWRPLPLSWDGALRAKGRTIARAAWHLRSLRPDALLPVCAVPNVVSGLTWRSTGARACVWNQRDRSSPGRFRPGTLGYAARRATLVAACAANVAHFVEQQWRVPSAKVRVVLPGVELSSPRAGRAEWRQRIGLSELDVAIYMAAHLHRFKDHETLLRAWRLAQDDRAPDVRVHLLLAGRPAGSEDRLKALAFDLDLRESVTFLGEVSDISGLALACDAAVLSSRSEGIGRSLVEAMAAGLPVAGTDIPGIREAVGPNGTELLAPPGDHVGLAGVLRRLVHDPDARGRIGAANAERAREVFSVDAAQRRYAAMVEEALERSAAASSF
jgi:glycosyltransferase involved in cell wall biosynthesis